jgi:hypothetical protein
MGREDHPEAVSPELGAAMAGVRLRFSDGGMAIDLCGGDLDSAAARKVNWSEVDRPRLGHELIGPGDGRVKPGLDDPFTHGSVLGPMFGFLSQVRG